jgi:UDP-3-O-[3-hydroxymyristoyl] glucosamine N-acyltransferase
VSNHAKIASGARLGAKCGVLSDIEEPGEYLGTPAVPTREWLRGQVFALRSGPKLQRELRQLNERVQQLEAQLKEQLERKG